MKEIKRGFNSFYIGESTEFYQAIITYTFLDDNTISADRTFVDPSLRGQGIAKLLVDALVLFARENNLKIIPKCSYVVRVLNGDEYSDVLDSKYKEGKYEQNIECKII